MSGEDVRPRGPVDIFITGTGINSVLQLTRETEQAYRLCNEILFLHGEATYVQRRLRAYAPIVTDLHDTYTEGVDRMRAYERMAEAVITAAVNRAPVALAVYGSPVVFVSPTRLIEQRARELGMRTVVLPAVSALENMFVTLGIDPSEGTLTIEANDLLRRRRRLVPQLHTFIWQIGAVESELFCGRGSRPERFTRIRDYVAAFYPEDQRAVIVSCPTLPNLKAVLTEIRLADLPAYAEELHQVVTLYLPPVVDEDSDPEFAALLDDPAHLARITREA